MRAKRRLWPRVERWERCTLPKKLYRRRMAVTSVPFGKTRDLMGNADHLDLRDLVPSPLDMFLTTMLDWLLRKAWSTYLKRAPDHVPL